MKSGKRIRLHERSKLLRDIFDVLSIGMFLAAAVVFSIGDRVFWWAAQHAKLLAVVLIVSGVVSLLAAFVKAHMVDAIESNDPSIDDYDKK